VATQQLTVAAPAVGVPIWVLVLLCGLVSQLVKFVLYSAWCRRPAVQVLAESSGLPSLHAATLTCLTVSLGRRVGWGAAETALALVFSVLVVHDAIRLKGASQQQLVVLRQLVRTVTREQGLLSQMAGLLNDFSHRPFHVAMGVLFGLFFALIAS
jgi:acid phosphatase family membrane protein YuiD